MAMVRRVNASGVQLHVEMAGEGSRTPIVFLHGWLRSSHEWRLLFPHFATLAPCYAIDLPGFGQSDIPDAAYDLPFFRDTIAAALDGLGLSRVRLIGHGIGGAAAFALGIQSPERVESISACSPSVYHTTRAGLRARLLVRGPVGKVYFERFFHKQQLRDMLVNNHFHEPLHVTDEVMDPILTWLSRPGARTALWKTLMTDMDSGLSADIARLTVPSIAIWGYNDRIQPVDLGKRLDNEVECVKLKQIPNVGYQSVEDRPLSVARFTCAHFDLPLPEGIPDGHPTPEEGDYDV